MIFKKKERKENKFGKNQYDKNRKTNIKKTKQNTNTRKTGSEIVLQEFGSISSPITKLNDQPLIHFLTARLTRLFSIINKSITTSATSGAGTAYPSGAPEFTPGFSGVRFPQSLVFCL